MALAPLPLDAPLDGLLLELLAMPSVYGEEALLCDRLEATAVAVAGASRVRRIGNSLVVRCGPEDPPPRLLLAGHLDTVAPPPGTGPVRREDAPGGETRLHGPGASDMKAGLALMLEVLRETGDRHPIRLAGGPPGGEGIFLVFYDREEGPYLDSGLGRVLDAVPEVRGVDLALLLEPTGNRVQLGCLGSLHATVRFPGRSAHSARPWLGVNPIHAAAAFIAEVAAVPPRVARVHGLDFTEVVSLTRAHAAAPTRNVIPDHFDLNLNFRFAPDRSPGAALAFVETLVAGRATVTVEDLSPAGPVPATHPLVVALAARTGAPPAAKQAWTDVARFGAAGIAAACFGPGDPAQAHRADEYVLWTSLRQGSSLLRRFLGLPRRGRQRGRACRRPA